MQVVRTELPPLKYLDGCLKLPAAKGALFAEFLPTVAVRHVAGNTTLYSVTYRRPKEKAADVSSPLILTVYQSDLRAKKFHVLLKMKVDVRLTSNNKSYRYGVAVAVDEVAECIYAVYSRDEARFGRRPDRVPGTRLFLRRVKLTLAAADTRGVRRLQRPGRSKIFEARTFFGFGPAGTPFKLSANSLKAKEGIVVQQLALNEGSLLLCSQWFTRGTISKEWAVSLLKLSEKRASMDVRSLPSISNVMMYCEGRRKFMAPVLAGSPREMRANEHVPKPYSLVPKLSKLGTVADAACRHLNDAIQMNSAAHRQMADGWTACSVWGLMDSRHLHQVFLSSTVNGLQIVSVRGIATVAPQIVRARAANIPHHRAWESGHSSIERIVGSPVFKVSGSWLLTVMSQRSLRKPSSTRRVILRANLRSLLPPKTVCANCNVAIRPSQPDNKKVCKLCQMRGFGKYSWMFGCHFCSAACLRDAWPQHSRLHLTPPVSKWKNSDWQQWRSANAT